MFLKFSFRPLGLSFVLPFLNEISTENGSQMDRRMRTRILKSTSDHLRTPSLVKIDYGFIMSLFPSSFVCLLFFLFFLVQREFGESN